MNDFLNFIKNGEEFSGVKIGFSIEDVIKINGQPLEMMGDNEVGYLQYEGGLRFGYLNGKVDEIAVIFYGNLVNIDIPFDGGTIIISEKTMIHDFILMLNNYAFNWQCFDEKNINVFCISVENKIAVLFDLSSGEITKLANF